MNPVRTAAILAVGSELLTPHRQDTNSLYLTGRLNDIGIDVESKSILGDDETAVARALREALTRVDLVITTGGLGPTADDITREAVANALGLPLTEDPAILEQIQRRFERRGLRMPDGNRRQAAIPAGASVLRNPNGTAPGLRINADAAIVVLLPGPPRELQPMFEKEVLPELASRADGRRVRRRVIKVASRPESHVEETAHPIYSTFLAQAVPIATTILAAPGQVELHLSARGADLPAMDAALDDAARRLAEALAPAVFSVDGRTLEQVVGDQLLGRSWRVAIAESCTGGMVSARLTDVPGSSAWFAGGVVLYANEAKTAEVGVPADVIASHGAVSGEVATAMAEGVRVRFGTAVGVGVTGIAGPSGGSADKPVGTVVIAVAAGQTVARTYRFVGDRLMVRQQSVIAALDLLRRQLASPDSETASQ